MEHIVPWMNHYGYIILFLSLLLELIALPIPGEPLMGYVGLLVFQGKMNWGLSILVACSGSIIGMTLAYWIGFALGAPFFHKYGHYIHLGPERLEKVSQWFNRYGNKLLVIAYFIPGVRHFTGYFSGINRLPFRTFALYAYTGALIWAGTVISLGKILGPQWEHFHLAIKKYLIIAGIVIAVAIVLYLLYKNNKARLKAITTTILTRIVHTFHSLGRVRFLVATIAAIGVILFIFMISLTEDFLTNEFKQFDEVVNVLVPLVFTSDWAGWMRLFAYAASWPALISVAVLSLGWIIVVKQNRSLEAFFLCFTFFGAKLFEEGLQRIFHHLSLALSHVEHPLYNFPSEHTLMVTVVYGFATFLLIRHLENPIVRMMIGTSFFLIEVLVGISHLYFELKYPSDIIAGYAFGGVWLSVNIVLLEINRLLRTTS
ncbi:membrane protein DedA with SNARE-associated domain [Aneurinibacillus soli]|uniref:Inner membrane protein YghB n=1 Tax=Aneurinibacillus soli TaxID=1500254 RepID=A0A0U5BCW3_9BACL|nr:VTT domain-containing protein [Aneurinibacillus soli]PYE62238.1 membrane protein DedA with SNARE-associated domain [Aneurinibacillus soli]BAU28573.1 Inner membrane protein YghB [Aneurinibacillus soli]